MKRLAASFLLAFAAGGVLGAATTSSSDLGGVFNDIGVGTRPLGMGDAFTAVANDANAADENPAGMAFFDPKDRFATFSYSDLYSLSFLARDYLSYAQGDQGYGAIGISLNRLSVDLSPGEWAEDALAYSGAKQIYGFGDDAWAKLAVGWQLKYLRVDTDLGLETDATGVDSVNQATLTTSSVGVSVSGGNAQGFGTGLGALLDLGPNLAVGLMLQDLYSELTWGSGTMETIPMTTKLGLAYHWDEQTLVSVEARGQEISSGFGLSSLHGGGEYWLLDGKTSHFGSVKNVGIRGGYYNLIQNQDDGVLTAGASVKSDQWQLDYTYEYSLGSDTLGNTQRFGLDIKF